VKAVYTVKELAELADVSCKRMRRILDAYGVEYLASGAHTRLVPLSQIREKVKPLHDSMQMRERYQAIVTSIED